METEHIRPKKLFKRVLQTKASRAEFLQYTGVLFLGIVGVIGLAKNLHNAFPEQNQTPKNNIVNLGYGYGPYGK